MPDRSRPEPPSPSIGDPENLTSSILAHLGSIEHHRRASGRTTRMIESLKDGDRVVFLTSKEAARVERLCRDRGLSIETQVADPANPHALFERRRLMGPHRVIYDHSFVAAWFDLIVRRAGNDLARIAFEVGGHGDQRPPPPPAARSARIG